MGKNISFMIWKGKFINGKMNLFEKWCVEGREFLSEDFDEVGRVEKDVS